MEKLNLLMNKKEMPKWLKEETLKKQKELENLPSYLNEIV